MNVVTLMIKIIEAKNYTCNVNTAVEFDDILKFLTTFFSLEHQKINQLDEIF